MPLAPGTRTFAGAQEKRTRSSHMAVRRRGDVKVPRCGRRKPPARVASPNVCASRSVPRAEGCSRSPERRSVRLPLGDAANPTPQSSRLGPSPKGSKCSDNEGPGTKPSRPPGVIAQGLVPLAPKGPLAEAVIPFAGECLGSRVPGCTILRVIVGPPRESPGLV